MATPSRGWHDQRDGHPVNDAPAGTDKTVTTLEDSATTFTAADFGFTDPDDDPGNALLAVSRSPRCRRRAR